MDLKIGTTGSAFTICRAAIESSLLRAARAAVDFNVFGAAGLKNMTYYYIFYTSAVGPMRQLCTQETILCPNTHFIGLKLMPNSDSHSNKYALWDMCSSLLELVI